jgi:release factor glutamine methyltransferase
MAAQTIRACILDARKRLAQSDIDDAVFNADCMAAAILNVGNSRLPLLWDAPATAEFIGSLESMVQRRCRHEPLQYIIGEWSFLDFDVRVGPGALIPRPETEEVFLAAAGFIAKKAFADSFRFADVGTGTGILGIAMARRFRGAEGFLVDISPDALNIATANLQKFPEFCGRVALVRSDLLQAFAADSLHVIVSNPPYIVSEEVLGLQAEVACFEPHLALDGGASGLDLIEKLVDQARSCLKSGGLLVFEHGHGQRQSLMPLFENGWSLISAADDLAGRERYVVLEKK